MCAVEWKALSEIFEMRGGYTPSTKNKDFWEDGILPWFRMEDIREKGNILSDSTLHITPTAVKKNGLFPQNSIILATSATIGEHALLTVPALSNQRFTAFYPKEKYVDRVNCKFAYYVFYLIDEWCKNNIVQGGFASVDMTGLKKYLFPIPSLAKQQEIVSQLDTFTTLIFNLESELDMRRKQYEHYRNQLLDFEGVEGVEWKTLGDVCKFKYGYTAKADDNGSYRYIRITDIDEYGRLYKDNAKYIGEFDDLDGYVLKKNDIVVARTGATFGKTLIFEADYPAVYASFLIKIDFKGILLNKYYWHFAQSKLYWMQANKLVGGGAQPQFNTGALSQVIVPIPSLTKQAEIVSKLDAFENLIQSLDQEIKLRQKQYEYYREKLLTFEKE